MCAKPCEPLTFSSSLLCYNKNLSLLIKSIFPPKKVNNCYIRVSCTCCHPIKSVLGARTLKSCRSPAETVPCSVHLCQGELLLLEFWLEFQSLEPPRFNSLETLSSTWIFCSLPIGFTLLQIIPKLGCFF